jgi:hypothetical protein
MFKRIIARLVLISGFILIINACAKISSPSGGPRDRLPPVAVKSVPAMGARNFRGNKIEILFDEYVVLDNINDKFMVSPPMKKKPRVLIRGKSVVVEFDDKLKDSTTYTFYFQDAIKDLNENNVLQNYQFVFSTGPVIDSLSVTGNIYNAYNLEVPEKTIVLMYRELADSAVVKHLPEYITRLTADGYFRIDNIRPGIYRLFGLKDADNSKNYNLPDEEFAFMDSTVVVSAAKNYIPPPPVIKDTLKIIKGIIKNSKQVKDSTSLKKAISKNLSAVKDTAKSKIPVPLTGEYRLFQFLALKKKHYLSTSHRDTKYLLSYILSLPADTMKFDFSIIGADKKGYFTERSKNNDTLKVWLTDSTLYSRQVDSTIVRYPFTDSLGVLRYKQDTILMRFIPPRVIKGVKVKRTPFTFESNLPSGFLKPGQTIVFKSKTPFREPDTSGIKLYEVEKTIRKSIPYALVKDSSSSCKYLLKSKLEEKKSYLFVADSASFGNIYNESCDSTGIRFSIKDPETYCKLTMEVRNYNGPRIIQLLDKTEKLISEIRMKMDGKVIFPLLEVGVYRLRVIYDLNDDGKWTTGNFDKHLQPEPVSFYPDEIELKTGWELEFTGDKAWDIGIKNFKATKLREGKKK